jgi:hypothetical protein
VLGNGGCRKKSLKEGERLRKDKTKPHNSGRGGTSGKDLKIQGRDPEEKRGSFEPIKDYSDALKTLRKPS